MHRMHVSTQSNTNTCSTIMNYTMHNAEPRTKSSEVISRQMVPRRQRRTLWSLSSSLFLFSSFSPSSRWLLSLLGLGLFCIFSSHHVMSLSLNLFKYLIHFIHNVVRRSGQVLRLCNIDQHITFQCKVTTWKSWSTSNCQTIRLTELNWNTTVSHPSELISVWISPPDFSSPSPLSPSHHVRHTSPKHPAEFDIKPAPAGALCPLL